MSITRTVSLALITFILAAAAQAESVVRFVALGDAGEGNAAQYQNGAAIEQVCSLKGCDFALYLGDNFYDDGVNSLDDPQWQTKFEQPYANLDFPFYAVLGNHDYGSWPWEFWKPWVQVYYTYVSPKWTMPNLYYNFRKAHVEFFALDSTTIEKIVSYDEQQAWLSQALAASTAEWKIVLAHHQYISNGSHGNASCDLLCLLFLEGKGVKRFVEDTVCGKADYYFSGHDHNQQWLQPRCGTEFIVTGAGSRASRFVPRADNNPVYGADDTLVGFMWVEIRDNTFTGEFYDLYGNLLFTRSYSR